MYPSRTRLVLAMGVLSASLSGVAPGPAHAQVRGLEEIIVTARKTEENIQAIPVAITSLTADDLLRSSTNNVREIAAQTPSLTIAPATGNPNSALVSLRGQVQNDTVFTVDPSVGIYLDEVYLGRAPGAMMDMYDVQRVEILKGPQGTLYGRNTTGGALKIITNRADPSDGLTGYARVGAGNHAMRKVELGVNVPLIQDRLAMRISGLSHQRDGYTESLVVAPGTETVVDRVKSDDRDTKSVRLDFALRASDRLDIALALDYSDIDTNGALVYNRRGDGIGVPVGVANPGPFPAGDFNNYVRSSNNIYKAFTNVSPEANNFSSGGSLTLSYELTDDIVAKAVYAHRRMDGSHQMDIDGTLLPIVSTTQDYGSEQDSLELQLTGTGERLDWVAGLYGFRETGYEISGQRALGTVMFPGGLVAAPYFGDGENESYSAYGQGSWRFTDELALTVGLRYTEDTKAIDMHNYTRPAPFYAEPGSCNYSQGAPNVDFASCNFDASEDYDKVSYTIGLDWQISDSVMLYAKTSEGYRAGGQNLRGTFAATQVPFGEESVTDYEVGVKSTLWDNRLRANLAVYRSDYEGIQTSIIVTDPISNTAATRVVNLTDATIDGAEAEISLQLLDQLVINVTGSYTNTKFDKLKEADAIATFPMGMDGLATPQWKYSVGAHYTQPLAIGDLSLDVVYSWRDAYWANPSRAVNQTPEAEVESQGLLNARLQLDIASVDTTIGVWATNLTDEEYQLNNLLFANPAPGAPASGPYVYVNSTPGEPRMFGIDITKRF